MASTYALPLNPTPSHSHKQSPSQYLANHEPAWEPMNGHSPADGGHRHHQSALNGQLHGREPSLHTDDHDHSHEHSRDRPVSRDSTYTLKPFMSARPKGRPRGESDLGRPPSRKSAATAKFGFSPIQEAPAPPPPCVHTTWYTVLEAHISLGPGLNCQKRSRLSSSPSRTSLPQSHTPALSPKVAEYHRR
jgi:solute carrier family 30 (zinc transporter), member 5/7